MSFLLFLPLSVYSNRTNKKAPHVTWKWYIPKETLIWVYVDRYGMYCPVSYGAWQPPNTLQGVALRMHDLKPSPEFRLQRNMICFKRNWLLKRDVFYIKWKWLSSGLWKNAFKMWNELRTLKCENQLWKRRSGSGLLPVKYAFADAAKRSGGKPNAMLAFFKEAECFCKCHCFWVAHVLKLEQEKTDTLCEF